jgi:septum formation protein
VLVLASASPRRRELLRWLDVTYEIDPPEVDEAMRTGETPEALVCRLARAKADAIGRRRAGDWILAADTVVAVEGVVLGKPGTEAEAADMLRRLAGREHRVATGFVLLAPSGLPSSAEVVVSRVRFRVLSAATIAAYVATGEPMDKAGGYAIQGRGAGLVEAVEGSFTNVIGLPLAEVRRALAQAGLVDG